MGCSGKLFIVKIRSILRVAVAPSRAQMTMLASKPAASSPVEVPEMQDTGEQSGLMSNGACVRKPSRHLLTA